MILSLYIMRRFVSMVARVFLVFFGILVLIDMIEQLRRFSASAIGIDQALWLAVLNVPETLYRVLPLIMIMASIALFLGLARSSELVVVRAAGRSGLRFLAAPVLAALVIGAVAVAVLNPIVAATIKGYSDLRGRYGLGGDSALSVADSGLWLRQGGAEGQTVIQALRTNPDGTELFGATFITFGPDGLPVSRMQADSARLEAGAWVLSGAKSWDLASANPELTSQVTTKGVRLASDLTADRIRDSFGKPSAISFWALPTFIAGLERAGFSARSYRLWFQMELAQPLLMAAMVLVAAGFTMRHARFGNTGSMVLLALLAGFALFFLRNFAQTLGANGQIPVALAAWSPPLAAALMALGLLLHVEDG